MMPEAADYIEKANECLSAARSIAAISLPAVAARSAVVGLALGMEGGDAFGEMRARAHPVAERLLHRLAAFHIIGDRRGDLGAHRLHRRRAVGGDHRRGLEGPIPQP